MNIRIIALACLLGFTSISNAATVETTLVFDKNSSLVTANASLPMTADFNGTFSALNSITFAFTFAGDFTPSPVPLPPAIWLLGSGLIALWSFRKKSFSKQPRV